MSALSPNIYSLLMYRFLQGLAIAGPGVVMRAVASDCFSGLSLTQAMTQFTISWALGPIIGPFIGGYLQHYFNWQANFYFFAIYGLLTFTYAFIFLPETHFHRVILHPHTLYMSIKEIVAHPAFLLYSTAGALIYSVLIVFNVIAPFLIQTTLHYSVIDYSHIALFLGFGFFVGNIVNRFMIHYIDSMKLILIASRTGLLVSILMLILGGLIRQNLSTLIFPSIVIFFTCAFGLTNLTAKCMSLFPKIAGTASAIIGLWTAPPVFLFYLRLQQY